MKTVSSHLRSFRVKVTLVLISSMLFVGLLNNIIIHKIVLDAQIEQLREKLMIIARTAALTIDPNMLTTIPLDRDGIYTPQYNLIAEKLKMIKQENKLIRYIYTMARTDQEGIWQFIVDPEPVQKRSKSVTAYPGDKYNASRFPKMLEAYNGASADERFEVDEWGVTLSGYAPIRNIQGKVVAILGVDMLASDIYSLQREVYMKSALILCLGIIMSFILGFFFSRRITKPIRKLVEGTRRVSRGDLRYKVEVMDQDEIGELAESFNKMADSLHVSQKKNQSYFYDVIQSLVRIVEAKDLYTRGHSERVSEHAVKIASRMGFSIDQVETLKETAMIHDIGKLGIQDDILNKTDDLSDQEWEIIKKHPVIGEEILRPVSLNEQILSAVRGHHERFDGTGYPDNISGNDINIFAQILSVADAYDAMMTSRAYRQALPKEVALAELKKNSGTQFHPQIVALFIKILEEDV